MLRRGRSAGLILRHAPITRPGPLESRVRENRTELLAGGIVLLAAAGFLFYALSASGVSMGRDTYPLTASFRAADGVTVGTDVRLAGVKVGTVSALDLNLETYRADATFAVKRGVDVPDDSAAVISQDGLLGGTYVELVPGGSWDMYPEGAEIIDTQGSVSLISLLMAFVGASEEQ